MLTTGHSGQVSYGASNNNIKNQNAKCKNDEIASHFRLQISRFAAWVKWILCRPAENRRYPTSRKLEKLLDEKAVDLV
jgi:hypothetical protein